MKQYNGEKAIISLTSWKARINTVSKTIYSILKMCPGFHIVLCLSEEEFPKKEAELPKDLMLFVDNDLIEILWVYKNYKAFKKILFTMDKYRNVPVISADDDCIYKFNYAEELYSIWLRNKSSFVSYWSAKYKNTFNTAGYATIHPPYIYGDCVKYLTNEIVSMEQDDNFYTAIRSLKKLNNCICLHKSYNQVAATHDENNPLHDMYRKVKRNASTIENMEKLIVQYK